MVRSIRVVIGLISVLAAGCDPSSPSRYAPPSEYDRLRLNALNEIAEFYAFRGYRLGDAKVKFDTQSLGYWTQYNCEPIYFVRLIGARVEVIEGFAPPLKGSGIYGKLVLQRKVDGSIRALAPKFAAAEVERMSLAGDLSQVTLVQDEQALEEKKLPGNQ